jgi:hypothetical protein
MPTTTAPAPRWSPTTGAATNTALSLFATVKLREGLAAEGVAMPATAAGTVIDVLDDGKAYVVEFFKPWHGVMTVPRALLEPDPR